MSGDSSRITAERLSKAEAERRYWKNRHEAALLRNEVETMSPDMFAGLEQKRIVTGNPTPLDRATEAHTRGIELNMFQKGLNGGGQRTTAAKPASLDPNVVIQTRAAIIKALATNHNPQEIESYLTKISPFLDVAMLAGSDPLTQSLLYAKIMGSSPQQALTVKDVVELVATVNQLKGSQPTQTADTGQLANALATAMRSGVEAARSNSNAPDPLAIVTMLNQSQQQSHQQQLEMYERLLESQQPRSLREQLTDLKDVSDSLGKLTGKESPEILMKRLELMDKKEDREFQANVEAQKDKRQTAMYQNIAGTLGKVLEGPILREAGRKMAESAPALGKATGAGSQVQSKAARSSLDQPLDEVFGFTCGQCGTAHQFSRKALTLIESSSSRLWACPRCGAGYRLGQQLGGAGTPPPDDKGQPPTVGP